MDLTIREAQLDDKEWIVALNQANTPAVGDLTIAEYEALESKCSAVWIAESDEGERLGFIMLLVPGRGYESPNYKWFENKLDNFMYVDRVAVTDNARGKGVGLALYSEALDLAEAHGAQFLTAEVNTYPENPVSLAFHSKLGFEQIGELKREDQGKVVAMLSRPTLNPEPSAK